MIAPSRLFLSICGLVLLVPAACTTLEFPSAGATAAADAASYGPALTSGPGGSTIVAYRSVTGPVALRTVRAGVWSSAAYLGGAPVTAPAVARVGDVLHLLVRRADGALWHRRKGSAWSDWRRVGGNLSSAPAAVGRADGRVDVFARGPNDGLRWIRYRPGTGWSAWSFLGGELATPPAAIRTGPRALTVCAAGADLALVCRRMTAGTWGGWQVADGSSRAAPALARDPAGRVHLFHRGLDGMIGHRVWDDGWRVASAPEAVSHDGLGASVTSDGAVLAGLGSVRNLHSATLTASGWSAWEQAWTPAPLPAPPTALTGRVVTRIPTTRKIVALTFDGGSGAQGVAAVRRTLQAERVPATTFLTGGFYRDHPTDANALVTTGLRVGNHSDTHPYFTQIGDEEAAAELRRARSAAMRTAGVETKPLFRFPYGAYTAADLAVVNRMGYVAVGWTVDTLGWKGTQEGITVDRVVQRVLAELRPGAIVLMHLGAAPDGSTLDAAALPRVIREIRARGYRFVTLGELAGW